VGSVWIIFGAAEFASQNTGGYLFSISSGSLTWSGNAYFANGQMVCGVNDTTAKIPQRLSTSAVYTVTSGATQIAIGVYPYTSGCTPGYAQITATRIA
jgi:hypothetical protein